MKTVSQVLRQALLSLEEKYHQSKTAPGAAEAAAPPLARPPASPASQADAQREVLRRFMHLGGQ